MVVMLCVACDLAPGDVKRLSGTTMGTYYAIQLGTHTEFDVEQIHQGVLQILAVINQSMSTYLEISELSQINRSRHHDWIPISEDLFIVLQEALRISQISEGAFDITVGPLVNLWGFGPELKITGMPDPEVIAQRRSRVGYKGIAIREQPFAIKKNSAVAYLDLSAIAKGYAVDKIADYLSAHGAHDFLVEIGGEIKAKGYHPDGDRWQIGIENPVQGAPQIGQIIPLEDMGLATSGDYRNYIEIAGKRYSHTIDPFTGYPVTHALVEVTVLNTSVMRADGLATALLVMGPEKGLVFAAKHQVAARFVLRGSDQWIICQTAAFAQMTRSRTKMSMLPLCADQFAQDLSLSPMGN